MDLDLDLDLISSLDWILDQIFFMDLDLDLDLNFQIDLNPNPRIRIRAALVSSVFIHLSISNAIKQSGIICNKQY